MIFMKEGKRKKIAHFFSISQKTKASSRGRLLVSPRRKKACETMGDTKKTESLRRSGKNEGMFSEEMKRSPRVSAGKKKSRSLYLSSLRSRGRKKRRLLPALMRRKGGPLRECSRKKLAVWRTGREKDNSPLAQE